MFSKYPVGTRLDVVDDFDVYSPATVIANSKSSITVHYLGWESTWDETITDVSRIGNCTKLVKAWARLTKDVCFWPCMLYLRVPKEGSAAGEEYLRTEVRMLVIPYGISKRGGTLGKFFKPDGVWVNAADVSPFGFKLDAKRISVGLSSKFRTIFSQAISQLNEDIITLIHEFHLEGTYDYSHKIVKPVPQPLTASVSANAEAAIDVSSESSSMVKGIRISFLGQQSSVSDCGNSAVSHDVNQDSTNSSNLSVFAPFAADKSRFVKLKSDEKHQKSKLDFPNSKAQKRGLSSSIVNGRPITLGPNQEALLFGQDKYLSNKNMYQPNKNASRLPGVVDVLSSGSDEPIVKWPSVVAVNSVVALLGQIFCTQALSEMSSSCLSLRNSPPDSVIAAPAGCMTIPTAKLLPVDVAQAFSTAFFIDDGVRELQVTEDKLHRFHWNVIQPQQPNVVAGNVNNGISRRDRRPRHTWSASSRFEVNLEHQNSECQESLKKGAVFEYPSKRSPSERIAKRARRCN